MDSYWPLQTSWYPVGTLDLCLHGALRVGHVAAQVAPRHIDEDIAAEPAVLVANHARTGAHGERCQLAERHLRACLRNLHQNALQRLQVAAVSAHVAHADRVALASFDGGGCSLSADGGHQHGLGIVDGKAVARQRVALEGEVEEVSAGGALGINAGRAGNAVQRLLHLVADALDLFQIGAEDLDCRAGCACRWSACRCGP